MLKRNVLLLCILVALLNLTISEENLYCDKDAEDCTDNKRYLFYDVNPPEGFNLRRDVYMRYAIFVHRLAKSKNQLLNSFKLVLPPWSMLYHWKRKDEPEHIPWGLYFDLESMRTFAPVIEMHEFFTEIGPKYGNVLIEEVYVLQHYQDMFNSGKFEDKMSVEQCNADVETNFYYYENVTSKNIRCLSFHGLTQHLSEILLTSSAKSILFDHGEVALHDRFGDRTYWKCRRSMRFNKDLISIATEYRRKFLNSTDGLDGTVLPEDWRDERSKRNAIGGPYLGVHLRRRDFIWGRPKQVPSIQNTAAQIRDKLDVLGLNAVFVATDAPLKEYEQLKSLLAPEIDVFKFKPNKEIKKTYGDGGVAIIEQIICSHGRYFMGTHESTFSFRIQEEREIMGFPVETTFNRLCGNEEKDCERTSMWKIEH